MNPELAYYVVRYYHNLMTKLELRANRHLIAILKLMHGRDDPIAQQQAIQGRPTSPYCRASRKLLTCARMGCKRSEHGLRPECLRCMEIRYS